MPCGSVSLGSHAEVQLSEHPVCKTPPLLYPVVLSIVAVTAHFIIPLLFPVNLLISICNFCLLYLLPEGRGETSLCVEAQSRECCS